MTTEHYRAALDTAVAEYERLGAERRAIDRRLAELAQTIGTLTRLLGLVPTVPLGLTEACRLVLRSGRPMTPVDVRDRLLAVGVDLSMYVNPLSAIHTVLKRLHKSGEIGPAGAPGRTYQWHGRPGIIGIDEEINPARRQPGPVLATPPAKRRARR